jgi:hypothetical protein
MGQGEAGRCWLGHGEVPVVYDARIAGAVLARVARHLAVYYACGLRKSLKPGLNVLNLVYETK